MNSPIRRLTTVILVTLLIMALGATYVQAVAGPRYRDDPRNFRVLLALSGKERGLIVTADGVTVAESIADSEDPRSYLRRYPHGPLYAHAVGFSSLLFGDQGIEAAFADDLRSKRDLTISDLITALLGRDLRARSIQLTLDHELQQSATEALGDNRGAVVALDPSTGAVLAFVSHPSFDVNEIVGPQTAPTYAELSNDPSRPLLNRASRQSYPPGSSFKVITAASALEAGLAGKATEFPDPAVLALPGSTATIRNADFAACGGGDSVTLHVAFRRSCNTTFGALAMEVGSEALANQAVAFGFNSDLPIEIGALTSAFPLDLDEDLPSVAQSGIGHRDVQATVLQMALAAAAVANGGLIMTPHLVTTVIDADGVVAYQTEPEAFRRATSPGTALLLADMMEEVVTLGTGRRAQVPGVRVAGKTGTAVSGNEIHAWFIGFAPVEDPTVALAVLVEDAGEDASGGTVAAPIAAEVLSGWFERNN
ncbi:MAG: peptidoglycan D,D-transpeptidase FtsI family protein [Acidimicrobiia bacterium]